MTLFWIIGAMVALALVVALATALQARERARFERWRRMWGAIPEWERERTHLTSRRDKQY